MLLLGGYVAGVGCDFRQVWALALDGRLEWSILSTTGAPPSERYVQTAVYDPVRDRMLVFGGTSDCVSGEFGNLLNDVWSLSLSGGSPTWTQLAPSGIPPSARFGHTAVYDPIGDRMIVFGGWGGGTTLNDAWALSLGDSPRWAPLALSSASSIPAIGWEASAIYDSPRHRVIVFGGGPRADAASGDVWALSLVDSSTWSLLTTSSLHLQGHTAVYDSLGDRMIVFGGWNGVDFGFLPERPTDISACFCGRPSAFGAKRSCCDRGPSESSDVGLRW